MYVIAVDIDHVKIGLARNNARVYGVEQYIEFIHANAMTLMQNAYAGGRLRCVDAVFCSPPWGGPGYAARGDEDFDLAGMKPYTGGQIMHAAMTVSRNVAVYLPRSTSLAGLVQLVHPFRTAEKTELAPVSGSTMLEVERNHFKQERKAKATTAYFGALVQGGDAPWHLATQ